MRELSAKEFKGKNSILDSIERVPKKVINFSDKGRQFKKYRPLPTATDVKTEGLKNRMNRGAYSSGKKYTEIDSEYDLVTDFNKYKIDVVKEINFDTQGSE